MAMFLVPMRQADSLIHEVDGFDGPVEECHATQQLTDRADDIGDIEVARRDFVQHRGEAETVVAVDEGDVYIAPTQVLVRIPARHTCHQPPGLESAPVASL